MNGIGIKSVLNRLLKIAVANGVENAIKVHIAKGVESQPKLSQFRSFTR